jgi:hypothetical protein
MNGIYLSPEGKALIEAKVAELETELTLPYEYKVIAKGKIDILKEILSNATVLPVEESWEAVDESTHTIPKVYPHGLIIQPKQ